MDIRDPLRLFPTISILAEELEATGLFCHIHLQDPGQSYRGIRLFHNQSSLRPDIIYLLRPGETRFPVDSYTYACSTPLPGKANHLQFPSISDEQFLDRLMEIFTRFQEWEHAIDLLVYRNAGLQELCELGADILDNPVCIHDDWFIMTAMSQEVSEIMEPEYLLSSVKGFIPRAIVEDFKYDSDYLETYSHRTAQIWTTPMSPQTSLYVNLWEGTVYRGRLLVLKKNREFRKLDFLVAELLTQRAILLLRNQRLGEKAVFQTMDDVVFGILLGEQPEPADQAQLLTMLQWDKSDRFACVRIRSQQEGQANVMDHILHGDLFRVFPGSYILISGHEQCLVINLTRQTLAYGQIHHLLAPLCRDYCLYAGISTPVSGTRELHSAYYQAGIALDQAFRLRSEKWILSFAHCALDHITKNLPSPLLPGHLVSPELAALGDYDRKNGTQYFETLRAYLLHERDIPKTSEALIIHRTTLLYRLKKIQALMHINMDDPWQRLYLMFSLWILEQNRSQP